MGGIRERGERDKGKRGRGIIGILGQSTLI